MKVLLLSVYGFGHGSMAPFQFYEKELKERFGIQSEEKVSDSLQDKIAEIKKFDGDLILVSVPWRCGPGGVLDFCKEAYENRKKSKLIFFDYGDGNESQFWSVMPYVDLYLKQYIHREMSKYQNTYLGSSEFIDYLVNCGQVENSIQSEVWTNLFQSNLGEKYYPKVMVGWNFGLWKRLLYLGNNRGWLVLWKHDRIHKRLATLTRRAKDLVIRKMKGQTKPIDVYCRATLYSGWTKVHRLKTINLLNELPDRYNIVSSVKRVGFSEYYREMENSKIFISPSGWCEYTPKDYEAMFFGALLIKPSVEHIDTEPNLLVPNQTYVPVKWDMSDLKEKVEFYLGNETERERITRQAKQAISDYYSTKQFLDKIEEILVRLDTFPCP